MDKVITFLVLSSLPQLVTPVDTSLKAEIKIEPQTSWIFTGESTRLTCSVSDNGRSVWDYQWFRGSELLPQTGENFSLWNAKMKESGNFSCGGVKDIFMGKLYTLRSLPVDIRVDGGLAILHILPHPGLIGKNMSMTCRVRRNPPVHEIILYKDGIEVRREFGPNVQFHFTNLTHEDKGTYSCRASWDTKGRTISVVSAATYVHIGEVLSQPVLKLDTNLSRDDEMNLTCHVQYNAYSILSTPSIHFYFYKDNIRLWMTPTKNYQVVKQTPGLYICMVKVLELGFTKWSEPKQFGEETGPRTTQLPPLSSTPIPETSALPVIQPITTPLITRAPAHLQYSQEPGEGSGKFSEESGDFSEESGDYSGGSGW